MTTKKANAEQVWKDFEDDLAPRLRLHTMDRVVYLHLLRHSRLEGQVRLQFSILWLARGTGLCIGSVRDAVRRLIGHGVLRLVQRNREGHVIDVRVPSEVRGARRRQIASPPVGGTCAFDFDKVDFLKSPELRQAIHAREGGRCFYCLSRIIPATRCLDHVVPQAKFGDNSWRNLVSSCQDCNYKKNVSRAADFLRRLHRHRHLTDVELAARFRALDALAAGKLRPRVRPEWVRDCRRGL